MTDLTERETIIVDLIRAAALAGDKCPTNVAMGLALGCNGTGTSQGLILDLERKGVITFERRGNIRRATIVAEGLSKECRYIKSEDTHDPDYCNEPVQAGSSYCPGHHSRCYIKRRPREDGKGEFSFRPLIVDAA